MPKQRRIQISEPTNFKHLIHVRYNSETMEYTDLPRQWRELIRDGEQANSRPPDTSRISTSDLESAKNDAIIRGRSQEKTECSQEPEKMSTSARPRSWTPSPEVYGHSTPHSHRYTPWWDRSESQEASYGDIYTPGSFRRTSSSFTFISDHYEQEHIPGRNYPDGDIIDTDEILLVDIDHMKSPMFDSDDQEIHLVDNEDEDQELPVVDNEDQELPVVDNEDQEIPVVDNEDQEILFADTALSDTGKVKDKLKKYLIEIDSVYKTSTKIGFLQFVYRHYPPRIAVSRRLVIPEQPEMDQWKKLYCKAIIHYHPDKVDVEKHGLKWKVLSEEITKLLTQHYEVLKGQ